MLVPDVGPYTHTVKYALLDFSLTNASASINQIKYPDKYLDRPPIPGQVFRVKRTRFGDARFG